jgi:hypothetical protein
VALSGTTAKTDRSTMSPIAQWVVWFGLGTANALLFGIGGVLLVLILLAFAVWVASRDDFLSASSGLLSGFGTTWLVLLGQQSATGGRLDDPGIWVALGVAPLAIGVLLGAMRLVRRGQAAPAK